ncbi:hypothetical protein VKT23_014065 [Stygiomarasmius scandens]|uniref:Uncharacterized protein n=1 Tax=Marasmiellus scandens TaxID=2682957 RepID=A0ABR1J640_9AGAR
MSTRGRPITGSRRNSTRKTKNAETAEDVEDHTMSSASSPIAKTTPEKFQARNGMALRGNRDAHPGAIVQSKPRRTTAEVQAEKAARQAAKDAQKQRRADAIARAAQIEDEQTQKDQAMESNANHPLTKVTQKKQRKKGNDPQATQATATAPYNRTANDSLSKPKRKRSKPGKDETGVELEAGTRSGSASDSEESDIEMDLADGLDDSGEEGNPVPKKRKAYVKGAMRAEVQAQRQSSKRPNDQNVAIETPAKRTKKDPQGLRKAWVEEHASASLPTTTPSSETPQTAEPNDDEYQPGGFGDEDGDDEERQKTVTSSAKPLKIKANNIAAIVKKPSNAKVLPTTSVPELVQPEEIIAVKSKRAEKAKKRDLSEDVRAAITNLFEPAVVDFTGSITAWDNPKTKELKGLWEDVMPDDMYEQFDEWNQDRTIERIAEARLTRLRNSMAKMAVQEVTEMFKRQGLKTIEERAQYVAEQTSGEFYSRPYYYLKVEKTPEKSLYKGVFQSTIIARTLSVYFKAIKSIPKDQRLSPIPEGALVLSILAAERAFALYKDGTLNVPDGPEGHFSAAQWRDTIVYIANRATKVSWISNLHSLFAPDDSGKVMVKERQWTKIIAAAEAYVRMIPVEVKKEEVTEAPPPTRTWELLDDDSDIDEHKSDSVVLAAELQDGNADEASENGPGDIPAEGAAGQGILTSDLGDSDLEL